MGGPPYVMYIAGRLPEPAAPTRDHLPDGDRERRAPPAGVCSRGIARLSGALGLGGVSAPGGLGWRVGSSSACARGPRTMARIIGAVLFLTGASLIARTF